MGSPVAGQRHVAGNRKYIRMATNFQIEMQASVTILRKAACWAEMPYLDGNLVVEI
jgi:hypothetical protein